MLPNATNMIESLPQALKRKCYDASGEAHLCALTQSTTTPSIGEFGVVQSDGTDELYVGKPFVVPSSKRLKIENLDGTNAETRRIDSIVDNVVFFAITLGERTRQ